MDSTAGVEPFLPQKTDRTGGLAMRLRPYLDATGMTPTDFAVWLRVKPTRVWSWLRGGRPSPGMIEEIYRLTRGEIGPQDWFPICNGEHEHPQQRGGAR
jgi:hypothetical protein